MKFEEVKRRDRRRKMIFGTLSNRQAIPTQEHVKLTRRMPVRMTDSDNVLHQIASKPYLFKSLELS